MSDQTQPNKTESDQPERLTINITPPEARRIPRPFLAWLSEYGYKALTKYLTEAGSPNEIIELVEALEGLSFYQESDDSGPELLGDSIAQLARGLNFVGVDLHGAESVFRA